MYLLFLPFVNTIGPHPLPLLQLVDAVDLPVTTQPSLWLKNRFRGSKQETKLSSLDVSLINQQL